MSGRIEDYALIGDLQTAALIGRDGSVDWLCLPRFDSPSCFAALLGEQHHGSWRLAPAGAGPCGSRKYRGDSLVLESEWQTATGSVRVTDFMPHRDKVPRLVRIVEGLTGSVEMRGELRLSFNYGRIDPWVRRTGHHRVAVAGPDSAWLRVPPGVHTYGADGTTVSDFTVTAGRRVAFLLTWQPSHLQSTPNTDPDQALAATLGRWQDWAGSFRYRGEWRDPVLRSLITLKALAYAPTGGIVAAPTAALPELIGGTRNWDYRFCWLRDSSMTLSALLRGGFREEAAAWRQWLLRAIAGDPRDLQTMYGVAGERVVTETEARWLPGYEGSRPVRFGNAAVAQLQLDVYGEVVDTLHLALLAGIPMERHVWGLLRALMGYLEQHWQEPDEGLWEFRSTRRHFVHSKVMAWVAADRAVRLAEATGLPAPVERWRAMRDAVHADVCANGYDRRRGTFVQHYGGQELDAATLFVVKSGFLPPDDPRVVRTVDAVRAGLDHGGFVRRYNGLRSGHHGGQAAGRAGADGPDGSVTAGGPVRADGLPGGEGAFLACSFWLADALVATGRRDEARELFTRVVALANDLGLLAEEWDPVEGRQLGNMPQAFTHVALVNTAFTLAEPAPGD
ncbi:glycoside hydrolase family 15 protein [Kitasatospora sp. NBC_00240]|uniref:glycoside hydrolase family 15 protein n=1 Tax=Kitasatospora sp. NBC_00240 TaxID=2903567 RepID=UPI0022591895|nr:glycoside hydrolase family 15 protein [Kitasatospora sp. NBC_00240]MCX5209457.1 glycoside hydrolase family 15 protein [Kitasatospora sp. NBC_00240]